MRVGGIHLWCCRIAETTAVSTPGKSLHSAPRSSPSEDESTRKSMATAAQPLLTAGGHRWLTSLPPMGIDGAAGQRRGREGGAAASAGWGATRS